MESDNPFFDLDTPLPPPATCQWCGGTLDGRAVVDVFLTGVFGYVYCAEECKDAHINSQ
jgi:hypothetical protein